jgi:hypothetical protein
MSIAIRPFKNASVAMTPFFSKVGEQYKVHLMVVPPATGEYQGQFFTFIFDMSGSMGYDACKVGDDATNYHTRMDLLKLVAELLVQMLTDNDTLYIVGFNDNGCVLMPPTKMTADGKASAVAAIKRMRTSGCTNIWNALEHAQAEMSKPEYAETLKHAIMLTDGEESYPASNHPDGTPGAFAVLNPPFALSILGFGDGVKPDMLTKLTNCSGGRFVNVADFTTLATTSINTLATAMASCASSVPLFITYDDGSTSEHKTGLIQWGQARNIMLTTDKKPVSACTSQSAPVPFIEGISMDAFCRMDMLDALRKAVNSNGTVNGYGPVHAKYVDTAIKRHVSEAAPDGELVKAIADAATWTKWGSKYTWSYVQALENDHRMNFKEQGQAHLGAAAFEHHKSVGDAVFSRIPKPIATGRSTTTPPMNGEFYGYGSGSSYSAPMTTVRAVSNVGATNDPTQAGGCWAPGSKILMADGSRKAVETLMPHDRVWVQDGCGFNEATVDYTLELGTYMSEQNMCRVGNLLLTWYHPVRHEGRWRNPCDLVPTEALHVPKVYNCILSNGHVVDIDGTLTVSLGHEIQDDGVKHPFFGSRTTILAAIKGQTGFAEKRVVYNNLVAMRDSNGLINGWFDGGNYRR